MSLIVSIKKRLGSFLLDIDLETDGITGVLGASGCGKTMLLKCIAGVVTPDEGKIVLNGRTLFDSEKKINLKPQERRVGYLFQNYALFPNMTVRQNIFCGLHREKDRAKREKIYRDTLDMLQLAGLEEHYPNQLSGGQQQRTALARILVSQPDIMLLDEPFSALDANLRDKLLVEMKGILSAFGGISVCVTHNRDEAYKLCESIALVDQGRIIAAAPTKELFKNPGSVVCASMTGCKNIESAMKVDEHHVTVPAWGVTLETSEPVRDGLKAVGIRAHYFNQNSRLNSNEIVIGDVFDEPFETTVLFRFRNQDERSQDVWWRLPKDRVPREQRLSVGIAPVNILLLYR
ncbi:MAG: ATP-binding cassette domain-containing protein [Clostridiales bacterium]|nr:ATP-binding cassette domain-containing protein [Clostridiales bacterium]